MDTFATRRIGLSGDILEIWQAERLREGYKVEESVLKELADTRQEFKASRAVIATTTYLTKGALRRVERDRYLFGKVDQDDLFVWMRRTPGATG